MSFSRNFYRTTAICSVVSAVTTLGLILLPKLYGPAGSFDERMALINNPSYQLRAWVYLVHPFVTIAAALGVAIALRRVSPGKMIGGLLGFLLWAFTEAGQQTLTLTAFYRWATAYPQADAAAREIIKMHVASYDAVWDAMFLLLLLGFLVGNILYGAATIRLPGLTRLLGLFYFAAALLTLAIISQELRGPGLPPAVGTWFYLLLQPAARFAIGIWLWRAQDTLDYPSLRPLA